MSGDLRIGDAERESVARALREHCAAGRLEVDELDARLERVYAARVQQDLAAVTADLPASGSAAVGPPRASAAKAVVAGRRVLSRRAPPARRAGRGLGRLRAARRAAPPPPDVRHRRRLHVGVVLHRANDGGTILAAFGEAGWSVRRAFASLRD